jgi:DNA-binding CsgD family transcriptional regulator
VIDHAPGRTDFIAIDNTPPGFSEVYDNPVLGKRDPVMQHCKRQTVPIIWDQKTYVDHDAAELWEQQARFGYRTGIAMALHMPEGRHFLLGVDRDQALPVAQDAAMRILLPAAQRPEQPALTPRELEALRWTMEGKTAWEVGAVMGISERTAVHHLSEATHKMGCANKHQAVLKALRLGLIH